MRNHRLIFVVLSLAMCLLLSSCSDEISTLQILHANINCSDLERSISFYEMLGFLPSVVTDVEVSAEEAAGLGMPPYRLRASPKMHLDGYVIDLIEWIEPYDPSAPYALMNHLGLSRISLKTTNLDADMTALQAEGVEFFSEPVTIDRPVQGSRLVCFKDPDGTLIELVELGGSVGGAPESLRHLYHRCPASECELQRLGAVTKFLRDARLSRLRRKLKKWVPRNWPRQWACLHTMFMLRPWRCPMDIASILPSGKNRMTPTPPMRS